MLEIKKGAKILFHRHFNSINSLLITPALSLLVQSLNCPFQIEIWFIVVCILIDNEYAS